MGKNLGKEGNKLVGFRLLSKMWVVWLLQGLMGTSYASKTLRLKANTFYFCAADAG